MEYSVANTSAYEYFKITVLFQTMNDDNKLQFSLVELTINDKEEIHQMLQQIPKEEQGFHNMFYGLNFEQFQDQLIVREQESRGENLPNYKVPQSIYWFYINESPAGMVKIRHYLNDSLREHGGHIGYALASKYRGKGYGNKMLHLALTEAKKLGIQEILLVCDPHNYASEAVITNNGGILEKKTDTEALYWIR